MSKLKSWVLFFLVSIGTALLLAANWARSNSHFETHGQIAKPQASTLKSPQTLDGLLKLPPAELNQCDIALMDLLCAQGLPGADGIKIESCLANPVTVCRAGGEGVAAATPYLGLAVVTKTSLATAGAII
jgi:hypothetical protein